MNYKTRVYLTLFSLFLLIIQTATGQDQKIADSLVIIYQEDKLTGVDKLELLRNLAFNELHDQELALKYADELIELSKSKNDSVYQIYLYRGFSLKGDKYRKAGDLELALELYIKSAEVAIQAKFITCEGFAYMSIADVYSIMGNTDNAKLYYDKSIQVLRRSNNQLILANAILNAGDEFLRLGKYEDALRYFDESGLIFRKLNHESGIAYYLGSTGEAYAGLGDYKHAIANLKKAITILEELEDVYALSDYLICMSDICLRQSDPDSAIACAKRSLELATTGRLKEQIRDANLQLSKIYEQNGNLEESYIYYKNYIAYRDSVYNLPMVQQIADMRTEYEVSQKQIEVDLINQKRKNQRIINIASAISSVLIILLALGLYRRYTFTRKTNILIKEEKNRSDNLLLNILPEETALELKQNGKVQAKKFESVSVLFNYLR